MFRKTDKELIEMGERLSTRITKIENALRLKRSQIYSWSILTGVVALLGYFLYVLSIPRLDAVISITSVANVLSLGLFGQSIAIYQETFVALENPIVKLALDSKFLIF